MAVPKKRTSKAKRNTRRTLWKEKISPQTKKSFSLASSILNKRKKISKQEVKKSPGFGPSILNKQMDQKKGRNKK